MNQTDFDRLSGYPGLSQELKARHVALDQHLASCDRCGRHLPCFDNEPLHDAISKVERDERRKSRGQQSSRPASGVLAGDLAGYDRGTT